MDSYLVPPIVVALGLAAWSAILSFRFRRWGQDLLLLSVSGIAPFLGLYGAALVMWGAMRVEASIGVVVMAFVWAWIAAVTAPIIMGFILHRLGRFTPLPTLD